MTNLRITLGVALLSSVSACSLASDFNFQQGDGGPTDSSTDSSTDTERSDVPEGGPDSDTGSPLVLSLTGLLLAADGAAVPFDTSFDPSERTYQAEVGFFVREVTLTATTDVEGATLSVAGVPVLSGESTPVELALGDNVLDVGVSLDGSTETYTLQLDRADALEPGDYLKGVTTGPPGRFGTSVAMAGDLLIVGAPEETEGGMANAGAAYIFERNPSGWERVERVVSARPKANGRFGASVATDGVLIAIGAFLEGDNEGAVYVFQKVATWGQSARIARTVAGEQFGASVAIEGRRLSVGAIGAEAVYTYQLTGSTTWEAEQTILPLAGVPPGSQFGSGLVIRGDTLVIAAAREDAGGSGGVNPTIDGELAGSGAVFVYVRSGSVWTDPVYLKAFGPQESDRFGSSIAFDGDLLAVGAPGEDGSVAGLGNEDDAGLGRTDSGAVYTYRRDASGVWTVEDYFKAEVPANTAQFGASLAIWGNLLFVGVPGPVAGAGSVSVYVHSRGAWSYDSDQEASNADSDDRFGVALGASEHGLVVGASDEDGDGSNPSDNSLAGAGATYSFEPQP